MRIFINILLITIAYLSTSSHADIISPSNQAPKDALQLSETDLQQNPALLEMFLVQAIEQNRIDDIRLLSTLLVSDNIINPAIYHYSLGLLAMQDSSYKQAITHFENILHVHPEYNQVSLLLMQALTFDKQYTRAERILAKLLADPTIHNPDFKHSLIQDKEFINKQQAWQLSMNGSLLHDTNINNAPKLTNYQGWQLSTPITAYGAQATFLANKTDNFYKNLSFQSQTTLNIKYYNKHQFDDIHALIGGGIIYQDSQTTIGTTPFYQKRWYATKPYSDSLGVQFWYQHQSNPKTMLGFFGTASQIKHQERTFLDGNSFNFSTGIYKPNHWISINHHTQNTQESSESYQDYGVAFGVSHSWQPLHLTHHFGINHRSYDGDDIFNIKRQDWRYHTSHQIKHKRINFRGYTPSLNIDYERVDSNHFAFDTEDVSMNVEIHKQF